MMQPEWAPQWGVMLAWPHKSTDWNSNLAAAEATYCALAQALLDDGNLLILCRDIEHEQHILTRLGGRHPRLHIHHLSYNDTWCRDFGPLALTDRLLDFAFNGWGNKFEHRLDNAVTRRLQWQWPLSTQRMVLEGGSIEVNGEGCLLTTKACLLNPNRNLHLKTREIDRVETVLARLLGVNDFVWLSHGHLEGDDTDAHIDTLARFVDAKTVAYVQCQDHNDSHYAALAAMEQELIAAGNKRDWRLMPLPHPPAIYADDGHRLPATYANFLITNHSILVPTYGVDTDQQALDAIWVVAGRRQVRAIDCRSLIEQHGSLHCVTMQLPAGSR